MRAFKDQRRQAPQSFKVGSFGETFQTLHGSPASLKEALNSPEKHTVEINGHKCTVEAAIKSRLIDPITGDDLF